MLSLERSALKELVLIALWQNETWNKYLMLKVAGQYPNSGRRYLLPLNGALYLKYTGIIEQRFGFLKLNITYGPVFARAYTAKC